MFCVGGVCYIQQASPQILALRTILGSAATTASALVTTSSSPNSQCREDQGSGIFIEDVLISICAFLSTSDLPTLLLVDRTFYRVLYPRWQTLFEKSPYLQQQKRMYYYNKSTQVTIVYSTIEKAQAKKFIGFNSKLGVSAYSFVSSGINVFARVRPAALGHVVGAVYTYTKWNQRDVINGKWVENTYADEELWRINIPYDESQYYAEEIWFSVFVRDSSGTEVWDTNDGWNYSASLLNLPLRTYEAIHPAVLQHEQNLLANREGRDILTGAEEDEEDFVEEVWLNVNHVMCS